MPYVKPPEIATTMLTAGALKANLPIRHLLIRGTLSGAFLAVATSMAVNAAVQTKLPIVGAAIFPFGLFLIIILGLELVTGSFALLPVATIEGKKGAEISKVLVNWSWVFLGNLLGSIAYAGLLAISLTMYGAVEVAGVAAKLVSIAETKTLGYAAHGVAGMITVFVKAILCNWMVSLAVVASMAAGSVIGKMAAIWGPVMLFFSQGFEHTVVNMFVIPVGMMMGAEVTIWDWWVWNQIPVTLGNIVGGTIFTGLAIYLTHRPLTEA